MQVEAVFTQTTALGNKTQHLIHFNFTGLRRLSGGAGAEAKKCRKVNNFYDNAFIVIRKRCRMASYTLKLP